jgi:hypothetical protein
LLLKKWEALIFHGELEEEIAQMVNNQLKMEDFLMLLKDALI